MNRMRSEILATKATVWLAIYCLASDEWVKGVALLGAGWSTFLSFMAWKGDI